MSGSGAGLLNYAVDADVEQDSARVAFCDADTGAILDRVWWDVSADALVATTPSRTFRSHKGQSNYPGTYWSATMRDHVIYESLLELAALQLADFDTAVQRISAQPFVLESKVNGVARCHTPDLMLMRSDGPVIVDAKPFRQLSDQKTAFQLSWTKALVEGRGWEYRVFTEPDAVLLDNTRFLAGYRREWLFDPAIIDDIRGAADLEEAVRFDDLVRAVAAHNPARVRACLLHLLWRGEFTTDLRSALTPGSLVRRAM